MQALFCQFHITKNWPVYVFMCGYDCYQGKEDIAWIATQPHLNKLN